jgi:hypothetical protein
MQADGFEHHILICKMAPPFTLSLQGADCFHAFMAWGLDKSILKRIWDAVAGNAGHLNQNQFIQCLYLMDGAKRGFPPPLKLPPGQFPPLAPGAALPPLAIGAVSAGPTGGVGSGVAATASGGFAAAAGMAPGAVAAGPTGAVAGPTSLPSSAGATPSGSLSGGQAAAIASITGLSGRT